MKRINRNRILILFLLVTLFSVSVYADNGETDETLRKEREFIRNGNKLYNEKRYADAEVEYKKALEVNPNSNLGNYNLALSLIKQSGETNVDDKNNPLNDATQLLGSVAQNSKDSQLRSKAYYTMGNIAYNQQDYGKSIEMYKNALRQNPDDEQARENLRLAQLKKNEQEQNEDNKNQDNKDDKKDKEQDKKENENKEDKKDDNNKQQQQQQPQPQEISKENMEQILQTMQNQEKATQEKVNAQKPQNVRKTGNQW